MSSNVQKFDSNGITAKRNELVAYNNSIKDSFQKVKNKMNELSNSWSGKAADEVIKNFDKLKKAESTRYKKQEQVIKLLDTINQGYTGTENTNKKMGKDNLSNRFI